MTVKGKPKPLNPSNVPVQSPVLSRVKAPPVLVSPEPKRLLNEELLIIRFVVEALRKDEYAVEEE